MLAIQTCCTWWLYLCVDYAFACEKNGYTLIEENVVNKTAIFCSNGIQDISSYTKLLNLISKDDVVGIYRRSEKTAQVCYGKAVDNAATLATLSGGKPYLLGMFLLLFLLFF